MTKLSRLNLLQYLLWTSLLLCGMSQHSHAAAQPAALDPGQALAFKLAAASAAVDVRLLRAVCYTETHFDARQFLHVWDNGAPSRGICQVKYDTAKWLGFKGRPGELMDTWVNTYWAAQYLSYQLRRYAGDWRKAVIAYKHGHYCHNPKLLPKLIEVTLALKDNV